MSQAAAQQMDLSPAVCLTEGERRAWRRRRKQRVSEWAEARRVVTDGPIKGPWSNSLTPYLVEPMDEAGRRSLRELVVVGSPQSGKTQILYNVWGYKADTQGSPALLVMADETTAHTVSRERLRPILEESPGLAADLLTGRDADLGKDRLRLKGCATDLAWATSVARLATMPYEFLGLDEVDKYPRWTGSREAAPVSLARARLTTYRYTSLLLAVSTCTVADGEIWRMLLGCQEVRVYGAVCPTCGEWQIMRVEQLRWDESVTDSGRMLSERLAWYECEHCGEPWSEARRRLAVKKGGYRPMLWDHEERWWQPLPDDYQRPAEPASVGFHFSAFYSPFVGLEAIAATAIRAKTDKAAEHELANNYEALPYQDDSTPRSEDVILTLCDERPPGLVPEGVIALTAGVDVQARGFYAAIRAWAPGPQRESWLVRAAYLDSWSALERVLFEDQYLDPASQPCAVALVLVDSGYHSTEVYDWCLAHRSCRPSKGWERQAQPFRLAPLATHPGLHLVHVNTTHYKDDLIEGKLRVAPGDPGAWRLHADTHPDHGEGLLAEYARHLCAEGKNEKGLWEQIRRRPNHYLDCEILNLAAADMLGLRFARPDGAPRPAPRTTNPTTDPRQRRPRPAWLGRR
ncbi:MAG: phage terminase large subunit family protein [Deltaproteobacteria bacterium]|nr:phage terminase large subunit family protein [Deltaproteobacteria bacterium]